MNPIPADASAPFPVVSWYGGQATFVAGAPDQPDAPWAVVVFVTAGDRFLIAHVPRGWCTPSGHVEPGEAADHAAARETLEETGATVTHLRRIGTFVTMTASGSTEHAAVYHGCLHTRGAIPNGSESDGAELFALDEVSRHYWRWDALMERMFQYALTVAQECGDTEARSKH
jgi:8-oxo-dGTP pyrophosphatase MutT (NUDIX family)